MLKVLRRFFFQSKPLYNTSQGNSNSAQFVLSEEDLSLASVKDIEWVTNIIEPEQQRGPSENA